MSNVLISSHVRQKKLTIKKMKTISIQAPFRLLIMITSLMSGWYKDELQTHKNSIKKY